MFYWSNSTDIAGQLFNRRNFFELRTVKIPLFYRLFSSEVNSEKNQGGKLYAYGRIRIIEIRH